MSVNEGQGVSPAPVLESKGLRKSFGGVAAVDGFEAEFTAGTVTGLVGPNGSGKSTVIDLLCGRLVPDGGAVTLHGRDVSGLSTAKRARLGLVRTFQTPRLWRGLSVGENLLAASPACGRDQLWRTFLRPGPLREREASDGLRAEEILGAFKLWPLRNDLAGTLSGGQARLLELGRVMMSRATVALLDEPLSGVNPVMSQQVVTAVNQVRESGVTVLLVEHHMEILQQLCPKVIGMVAGRVVASGPLDFLLQDDAFTGAYLGETLSGNIASE